ncbi:A24 family peptidase [Aurantimonas endophytica]|uniref:Prepilin peptidase CpaA n=1 Tax=Aurantimonas endophytica TaxID=1522175 RepID=A0A7W6HCN3_9HYPH|nr:prepilin peptidase [Aurantimonas endophytica]MBB4002677.1 prepilin peptidase CpaA [Aurantimonas endophytica]MCO6403557.1 peptidase [Aurantimonas endophytica]
MLAALLILTFPIAMIYAAMSDLVSMTIANRVSLALVAAFPLAALMIGLPGSAIGAHFVVGIACLVVTFGMFAAGWMGGGDAKLLAATALWLGPTPALAQYLLFGAVFGGVLTVAILLSRASLAPVTGIVFVDRLLSRDTGIPYGIALGAAGLTVFADSAWMDHAVAGLAGAAF